MKRIALIGLPFDDHSSYMRGAAEAPPLIRRALWSGAGNLWSESGIDLGAPGVIHDAGDIEGLPADAPREISRAVAGLLEQGFAPICLGGDHSVTYPIVRSVRRFFPALAVVDFDAHPDTYDEFQGDRLSHGCPFARIMEEKLADRLIQVGVRADTGELRAQARRFGIRTIGMDDWREDLVLEIDGPIYVSVDMDVLDPAFAPGVSHHEPGGCTTRMLLRAIRALRGRVVGADIVEFNPRRDPSGITAAACAKVLKELAGKMLAAGD